MVQESGPKSNLKAFSAVNRNDTSYLGYTNRKASQESVKQYSDGSSKNGTSNKYADNGQKYGAWGSVYKNKDNFVNMHLF